MVYWLEDIVATAVDDAHLIVEGLNDGAILHKVCGALVALLNNYIATIILKSCAHIRGEAAQTLAHLLDRMSVLILMATVGGIVLRNERIVDICK